MRAPDRYAYLGERGNAAPASFAGQATFDGFVAWTAWDREALSRRLGSELRLAEPTRPASAHPVVVVCGEQRRPAVLRVGLAIPVGRPYGELGVMVPYVQRPGDRRLYTYVWHMRSSYFPAVWEGNARYFAKALAAMRRFGDGCVVTDERGRPVLDACVRPAGDWRPGTAADASLDAIRDAFALPALGRPATGRWTASRFAWDFAHARVAPATATLALRGDLVGGPDAERHVLAAEEALAVRGMTWRLGWPGDAGP